MAGGWLFFFKNPWPLAGNWAKKENAKNGMVDRERWKKSCG